VLFELKLNVTGSIDEWSIAEKERIVSVKVCKNIYVCVCVCVCV